jgi:hypothetical protein
MSTFDSGRTFSLAGITTRAELLTAGMSRTQIEASVRRGSLTQIVRGIYARPADLRQYLRLEDGERLLHLAAVLTAAGPGAALSHQTAAELQGIDLLGESRTGVTLTCRPEHGWRSRTGTHVYANDLPADHVSDYLGLPVTTPARTVVDLARTLDFQAGVVAADSAMHRRLTNKAELRTVIAALPQRRGIVRAAEVVEFADMEAESPLESIARIVFRDCGLPTPELQVWLGPSEKPIGRVDFYWAQYRTIAEVDGGMKYDNPSRARDQLRRDARFRAEGFEIVHFTWQDINYAPLLVARLIREAFERGARNAQFSTSASRAAPIRFSETGYGVPST